MRVLIKEVLQVTILVVVGMAVILWWNGLKAHPKPSQQCYDLKGGTYDCQPVDVH